MDPSSSEDAGASPLAATVTAAIHALLDIKARLPFLRELAAEFERVASDTCRNTIVLTMAHDTFDMLVIDLYSLREDLTQRGGVFDQIAGGPERLRRFKPDDFPSRPHIVDNPAYPTTPVVVEVIVASSRQRRADDMNAVLERLFPLASSPVSEDDVKLLIRRFLKDTERLDQDRNRVRAHRYNRRTYNREHEATIGVISQQVGVFERYLNDLLLLVARESYDMTPATLGHPLRTAEDIVDLVVCGSIHQALLRYGVVTDDSNDRDRLYWLRRESFYRQRT